KNLHIHVHSFQDWKFPDGGSVSVIMKNLMEQNHHLYISARRKRSLLLGREEDIGNTFLKIIEKLRSEEHTSELQSRFDLVCRLLLEKKKKNRIKQLKLKA